MDIKNKKANRSGDPVNVFINSSVKHSREKRGSVDCYSKQGRPFVLQWCRQIKKTIRPALSDLENKLSDNMKQLASLQQFVNELAAKQSYNPNEDHTAAESQLQGQLETFLETVKSFNTIYTKEICPWTHMMELPQLHGLGPAANRLLDSYKLLLKLLRSLRNLRDSYAAVAAGSDLPNDDVSASSADSNSVSKLISECEDALVLLNHDLSIISSSRSRELVGLPTDDSLRKF